MVLLDAAILMNPQVWVASGHVGGFSDPLVDDKNTKERFRADKLIEDELKIQSSKWNIDYLQDNYGVDNLIPESWTPEQQHAFMVGEKVNNPNTWEAGDWTEIRHFNLMFKTSQWVTDDSSADVYLRPETAQGIFVDFPSIVRTSRKRIPFWVAQVGKAFRNEITPGNFIFRTREFEQMEIEFFCEPGTQEQWQEKWKEDSKNFLTDTIGISKENLRFREHETDELSHYSDGTFDIDFNFPGIWFSELQGIASRTDFDLKAHMQESGQDMSYFDPITNTKFIPFVIEPSLGLTRLFLAVMCDAYDEVEDEKQGKRIVMRFKPEVAPIKVWVLPLQKNKLGDKAREVFSVLSEKIVCEYDETGSIGKRYARMDEIGTPWCVTVDFDTQEDGCVTVRDRDSGEQERVPIDQLVVYFESRL